MDRQTETIVLARVFSFLSYSPKIAKKNSVNTAIDKATLVYNAVFVLKIPKKIPYSRIGAK